MTQKRNIPFAPLWGGESIPRAIERNMGSVGVGLIAFACFFGCAMLGMFLHSCLPEHHQTADTQRIVTLGAGIIGTMAALILGLLVASAKGSYDAQYNELTTMAARIALLDRGLAFYGPEARSSREALRRALNGMVEQLWPNDQQQPTANLSPAQSATVAAELYESVYGLSPQNEAQRDIKAQAIAMLTQIGEQRWLIIEQKRSTVSEALLVILIFSLAINFFSFGLFAPRNATVVATLCLCALASSGAILIMMQLYHPYEGLIQIPSTTLKSVLMQLR